MRLHGVIPIAAVLSCLLGRASSAQVQANYPDLRVTAVRGPTGAVRGNTITVTGTVANRGSASAQSGWLTRVFLSTDTTITAADTPIGTWTAPALMRAGDSVLVSAPIQVPATTPPGQYYLGMIADATNLIRESVEFNNSRSTALRMDLVPNVDLYVTGIQVAVPTAAPGATVTAIVGIRNGGTETLTTPVPYQVFLSRDAVKSVEDSLAGSATTLANAQVQPSIALRVPADHSGSYYLIAVLDPTHVMPEIENANNTSSSATTLGVGFPDLTVTNPRILTVKPSLIGANGFFAGDSVEVEYTVFNASDYPTPHSFGLRIDVHLGESRQQASFENLGSMAPRETRTLRRWIFPYRAWPFEERQYLEFRPDPTDIMRESNEFNNSRDLPILLYPRPDLVPAGMELLAPLQAGKSTAVRAHVANTGGGMVSTGWTGSILLLPASGPSQAIGTFPGPVPLASNEARSVDVMVTVPLTFSGSYSIVLRANFPAALAEAPPSGDNNNVFNAGATTVIPVTPLAWNTTYPQPGPVANAPRPVFTWPMYSGAASYQVVLESQGSSQALVPTIGASSPVWVTIPNEVPMAPGQSYTLVVRAVDVNARVLAQISYPARAP